jgi:hypothetical protein
MDEDGWKRMGIERSHPQHGHRTPEPLFGGRDTISEELLVVQLGQTKDCAAATSTRLLLVAVADLNK